MAWGEEESRPGEQNQQQKEQQEKQQGKEKEKQKQRQRRRSSTKPFWRGKEASLLDDKDKKAVILESPSVVSKMTDLNEYKVAKRGAVATSTTTKSGGNTRGGNDRDDRASEALSQRAEASLKRRMSRRRESSLSVNVSRLAFFSTFMSAELRNDSSGLRNDTTKICT